MSLFFKKIHQSQKNKKSFLCVGLDPRLELIPRPIRDRPDGVFEFLKEIVDGVEEFSCCFKPQIACFSAYGLEKSLTRIIQYIHDNYPETPVILDAKRNDIGPTSQMYAIEAFERYGADAVTLNPYMGWESVQPFVEYRDKGVFILCRTSNPGADRIQNLRVIDGETACGEQAEGKEIVFKSKNNSQGVKSGFTSIVPDSEETLLKSKDNCQKGDRDGSIKGGRKAHFLYQVVAGKALNSWNPWGNVGLVTGATALSELRVLREEFPGAWFLVPGIGSQGGDLSTVMEIAKNSRKKRGTPLSADSQKKLGALLDTDSRKMDSAVGNSKQESQSLSDIDSSQSSSLQKDEGPGGLIINCSRAILYAGKGEDFVEKARQVAGEIQSQMKKSQETGL